MKMSKTKKTKKTKPTVPAVPVVPATPKLGVAKSVAPVKSAPPPAVAEPRHAPKPKAAEITLLFLAAHPEDIDPKQKPLRLDKEAREIQSRVGTAKSAFKVHTEWAVTSRQLLDAVKGALA